MRRAIELVGHPCYAVAQLGSRMHYAVPRILQSRGILFRLFTDACAAVGWPRLLQMIPPVLRPAALRRLLSRVPSGVPPSRITAFNAFGWEYNRRLRASRTPTDATAAHLGAGRKFCRLVLAAGLKGCAGLYCFNSAGLELLQHARAECCRGILD